MNDIDQILSRRRYMERALQLARGGELYASTNPMVGAVIVARDRVIGEGYHRQCGQPHAEVNAIASVSPRDRDLLKESTMYVTLEPCSHYGKTPPCAKLIIETGIPHVVVGAMDPFREVSGRGVEMLRQDGCQVDVGVMRAECESLNEKFMTAHRLGRPYITLKWARSANGIIGTRDVQGRPAPVQLSNLLSQRAVHRLRATHDAIMVGMGTVLSDNPRLDTRLWPGRSPRIVTICSHGEVPPKSGIMRHESTLVYDNNMTLSEIALDLYSRHGITSLLVEGGATLLQRFIDADLYDAVRRETATSRIIEGGIVEPHLPAGLCLTETERYRDNLVEWYRR